MLMYGISFSLCIIGFYAYEKGINEKLAIGNIRQYGKRELTAFFSFFLIFLPLIIFYGLRVNVGTDYEGYVDSYRLSRETGIGTYIHKFLSGAYDYYEEPGYHIINRISYFIYDDAHTAFLLTGFLLFFLLFLSLRQYKNQMLLTFGAYIYLMTQFAYALNGVRFAIAFTIMLFSFQYIVKEKFVKFCICIMIATLFHKTALCCFIFYLLKKFNNKQLNKARNIIFYIGIICTPLITKMAIYIASLLPFFKRYFEVYVFDTSAGSLTFLWRILPSLLPVIFLIRFYKISLGKMELFLNVLLCRIPLLYLGYYYMYASRLDRYAWISEIILIPFIVRRISDSKMKVLFALYFIMWYLFIFYVYYVVQATDLFPYQSVFNIY